MAKMNSTSLYVTTNQIILRSTPSNPSTWQDLYRLVPYLRNSLCCVVCGNLLVEPQTPAEGKCQHHLCKKCKGGRKKIKPACALCKDLKNYNENKQLRILLQCYKRMCISLINSGIFVGLLEQASKQPPAVGAERGAGNLIMLIREGASFYDEYQSNGGLSKSAYSILPCVYTNSATQTLQLNSGESANVIANRTRLYSVMCAGSTNKITIKRKPKELEEKPQKTSLQDKKEPTDKAVFKKPPSKCVVKQRKGCRCGNATATPGKLTCCGQRCPCYVESKACIDCKCRGCRNPHRPDGNKVRPLLPNIAPLQYNVSQGDPSLLNEVIHIDSEFTLAQFNQHFTQSGMKVLSKLPQVSTSLPQNILMSNFAISDEDDEITVDV